jgi:hypothetical protein
MDGLDLLRKEKRTGFIFFEKGSFVVGPDL